MNRDDRIALGMIAMLVYGIYLGSRGTARSAPERRIAPAIAPRLARRPAPPHARLWRAFRAALAIAIFLAALPFAAALALLRIAPRRGRRRR